jgi:hypothetical protein
MMSWAAQTLLAGHMRPAGRVFETPGLVKCSVWSRQLNITAKIRVTEMTQWEIVGLAIYCRESQSRANNYFTMFKPLNCCRSLWLLASFVWSSNVVCAKQQLNLSKLKWHHARLPSIPKHQKYSAVIVQGGNSHNFLGKFVRFL